MRNLVMVGEVVCQSSPQNQAHARKFWGKSRFENISVFCVSPK